MAVIFVLVDGVGLAPAGPANPVARHLPWLTGLLGTPLVAGIDVTGPKWLCRGIDATLGMPGLPQSGSGHTALYGGFNAAAFNGRHQPSFPTIAMRERLTAHNLFSAALAQGGSVAWATATLHDPAAPPPRRSYYTAGLWSALAAGVPLRGAEALAAGTAVSWDINQHMARERPGCAALPVITPEVAGERLARLAHNHTLVAFDTYLPDLAGHERLSLTPAAALELVDGLLHGVIANLRPSDTLIVTSDHGNVEDASTRVHTRNPVPLLVVGPGGAACARISAIDGILAAIVELL